MKNKITITILMVAVFIIGVGLGMKFNRVSIKNNKKVAAGQQINNKGLVKEVKLIKTLTESRNDVKLDKGDIYKEYSNGAWSIENDKNNIYELSIPELGDWTYEVHRKKDFNNLTQTYFENINNTIDGGNYDNKH